MHTFYYIFTVQDFAHSFTHLHGNAKLDRKSFECLSAELALASIWTTTANRVYTNIFLALWTFYPDTACTVDSTSALTTLHCQCDRSALAPWVFSTSGDTSLQGVDACRAHNWRCDNQTWLVFLWKCIWTIPRDDSSALWVNRAAYPSSLNQSSELLTP